MRPEIAKHFPYPSAKPGQGKIIEFVIDKFEGGAKNVIVEAPTGLGKTGVAVTVARYMSRDIGSRAHLITSQKMLQRAYLKDDPKIRLMMGKSNYECERGDGFSCEDATHAFGGMCQGYCTYLVAREAAQEARITLHNFDSFLHQATLAKLFEPRRLLCIDEAHDAEEHLIKAMSLTMTESTMNDIDIPWHVPRWDDEPGVKAWVEGYADRVKKELKETNDEMKALVSTIRRGAFTRVRALSRKVQKLEKIQLKIERFLSSSELGVRWVQEVEDNSVTFEPVSAGRFANSALLKFGEHRLFMSATIFNKGKTLMKALRLKDGETEYISVGSSFPVDSRPITPAAIGDLGHKKYESNREDAMRKIRTIIKDRPGVRGVIHCTSYKLAQEIGENIKSSRLVFHRSDNRQHVIERFLSGKYPDNSVLVAVSVTQGYDFKYDLCRFQVLVRVPFPYPSKRIVARRDEDPEYYDWRTALALVQTTGRGNRAEDDFCETFVLDSRFSDFIKRKRRMLPRWFLDSIVGAGDDDVYLA